MQAGEPSHTARGAAACRAIHQTLENGVIFSDPFASRILDDETRARLDETAADSSLGLMRLFIAARSRFSEDTLAAGVARGLRQVVVLGAGLDTFSLRNFNCMLSLRCADSVCRLQRASTRLRYRSKSPSRPRSWASSSVLIGGVRLTGSMFQSGQSAGISDRLPSGKTARR